MAFKLSRIQNTNAKSVTYSRRETESIVFHIFARAPSPDLRVGLASYPAATAPLQLSSCCAPNPANGKQTNLRMSVPKVEKGWIIFVSGVAFSYRSRKHARLGWRLWAGSEIWMDSVWNVASFVDYMAKVSNVAEPAVPFCFMQLVVDKDLGLNKGETSASCYAHLEPKGYPNMASRRNQTSPT